MNLLEDLEKRLKSKKNAGTTLPDIRFFDGNQSFSDPNGNYKGKTLEESLMKFSDTLLPPGKDEK